MSHSACAERLENMYTIIIIMSGRQKRSHWRSPATRLYRPSLPHRSAKLHHVLAQNCCIKVLAGRPALARPCEGVHKCMSLMSSSLLLKLCLACPVRLNWIVFCDGWKVAVQMLLCGGAASRTCSILPAVFLCICRQAFFSIRLVSVHVVHPYTSTDTTVTWKKLCFILSVRSDFHMTNSLWLSVHAFASRLLLSLSVDETLLPR